ncbi:tetratricopeptide-like helical domain-containing protein [Artemisia annua]|uniref:Tetratricopeptide-like helical domain-containing protein n=1 Tax=Artemisia annua TaxID=35608 RepID=A0A2U1PBA7_ARTAN|nr:tetratricopeptide-like helical domain-containing protein [Artemisia annua]
MMNRTRSAVNLFLNLKGTKSFAHPSKNPFGLRFGSKFYCTNDESSKVANLNDALKLFNGMTQRHPLPSVDKFNKLLSVVNNMKHYSTSVDFYKHMCSLGLPVDYDTMNVVVDSCCQLRCANKGGFAVLGSCLMRGVSPDVVTFSSLLNGLVREDKIRDAEKLLKHLICKGVCEPDLTMYNTIIKALCKVGPDGVKTATDLLRLMNERGCKPDIVGYSAIIDGLCKEQRVDEAFELFKEMVNNKGITPDVFTYNSLIDSFCYLGCLRKASKLLKHMMDKKGISPDRQTFNILIKECCKEGHIGKAEDLLYTMMERGFHPDTVTYNSLIDCYSSRGDMDSAKRTLNGMVFADAAPDIVTYNIMLKGYCKKRPSEVDQAICTFHKMEEKFIGTNGVTYKIIIEGLCSVGRSPEAHEFLKTMHAEGYMPDEFTYHLLLECLCSSDQVEEAISLVTLMGPNNPNRDMYEYNFLIEWAFKCEKLDIARAVFDDLPLKGMTPNDRTYELMIHGFCSEGLVNDAKHMFLQMKEIGFTPSNGTYIALLQGYLKNKHFDDVEMLLQEMDGSSYYLDVSTLALLSNSIAAGSLYITIFKIIRKLVPKRLMESPCFSALTALCETN